jgi:pimeloyl-ACP methyl ester carboxylesterase
MSDAPLLLPVGELNLEVAWHGSGKRSGPVVVMLHEGLGCVAMWRDFPAKVAEATGLRVLAYSRAGHGASSPVSLPRSLEYMHDEARETLPRLLCAAGIDDLVLFGHSDGASIALLFAGSAPKARVRGLILEAPHVFCEELSVTAIRKAREAFLHGDLEPRLERYHRTNTACAFWGWNDAWLDPGFRSWNIEEVLPRVRVPALVIQSPQDPYGTLAQVEAIERGSGAPVLRALLGSGHRPHREDPLAVLIAVRDFVLALRRSGS